MAVYGYTRVSTNLQVDRGESLDVQGRRIEGYAMQHDFNIDHVFVERGVSGAKPLSERPEGTRLIAQLRDGDVVISPKLDRMFRSAIDALTVSNEWKERAIRLHLIDLGGDVMENGMAKMFFTIAAAFAEAERDRIRERIVEVKADQRKRNRYLGGIVPFGWRVGDAGVLVRHAKEQGAIERMVEMRAAGLSLRAIAEALSSEGFRVSHAGAKKIIEAARERDAA